MSILLIPDLLHLLLHSLLDTYMFNRRDEIIESLT